MGEVENQSTRKVNFLFDFLNDAIEITAPDENRAVYDILVWNDDTEGTRRGNLVDSKYFLNNGTVHLRVIITETKGLVCFVVDPNWDGTSLSAITRTTVNSFYEDDQDVNYATNSYGHIIYYLEYDNGFTIEGEYPTWTFTPNPCPVRLTVTKFLNKNIRKIVTLAKYDYLPFQFTVSLNGLAQLAPRKNNTLSISWGKLKGK